MCSFLHVFLALVITFTLLQDYSLQEYITPEGASRSSEGSAALVFLQERLDLIGQTCSVENPESFEQASQQGQEIHCADQFSHESRLWRERTTIITHGDAAVGESTKNGQSSVQCVTPLGQRVPNTLHNPRPRLRRSMGGTHMDGKLGRTRTTLDQPAEHRADATMRAKIIRRQHSLHPHRCQPNRKAMQRG